jgi:hypothetical protein
MATIQSTRPTEPALELYTEREPSWPARVSLAQERLPHQRRVARRAALRIFEGDARDAQRVFFSGCEAASRPVEVSMGRPFSSSGTAGTTCSFSANVNRGGSGQKTPNFAHFG